MKSPTYTYKKANYLYNIHDIYTAGVMFEGWEVKSLDNYKGDINVGYCIFKDKKIILKNVKITPMINHVLNDKPDIKEKQDRILLLNKTEIKKISDNIKFKGFTIIPLKLYRNKHSLWKIDIALVTGKTNYDKRQATKEKDIKRDLERES